MLQQPPAWRGTVYRTATFMRVRLHVLAGVFVVAAVAALWYGQRLLGRAAEAPSAADGLALVLSLLLLGAGVPLLLLIAWLMVRWAGIARLELSEQGIMYAEPAGVVWTTWDNVARFDTLRSGMAVVEGLRLRGVPGVASTGAWRTLARLLPLFLPSAVLRADERFLPLSSLGLSGRAEGPLRQQLLRYAPWLFGEAK